MAEVKERTGTDLAQMAREVPQIVEPRCHICGSISRTMVDRLLVGGLSHMDIAHHLKTNDDHFKNKRLDTIRKNIERHDKRHVNIRERTMRMIIERRAAEQGLIVSEMEGSLVTPRGYAEAVVNRAYEQLSADDSVVRHDTALEAAKMLEEAAKSEYLVQLETMKKQVWAISQAVKENVPTELYEPIKARALALFQNPTLESALPKKMRTTYVAPDAIEVGTIEIEEISNGG